MTSSNSVTIEYSGSAVFVGAFAQALTDEGLQVRYDRPPGSVEERGVPSPGTVVQVYVLIEAWVSEHPVATAAAPPLCMLNRRPVRRSSGGAVAGSLVPLTYGYRTGLGIGRTDLTGADRIRSAVQVKVGTTGRHRR